MGNASDVGLVLLLGEHDLARIVGLSVKTVRRWRLLGQGPSYLKLGFGKPVAELPQERSQQLSETETQISESLKRKRQEIVHRYNEEHELNMAGLASHAFVSLSALHGIIREDRNRYSETTRNNFLKKIGVSVKRWYQE